MQRIEEALLSVGSFGEGSQTMGHFGAARKRGSVSERLLFGKSDVSLGGAS